MKIRCIKDYGYRTNDASGPDALFVAGNVYEVDDELGRRLLQSYGPEGQSEPDVRFEAASDEEAVTTTHRDSDAVPEKTFVAATGPGEDDGSDEEDGGATGPRGRTAKK